MTLIQKIKNYFIKYDFYSWKGFDWSSYEVTFDSVNDETLLDIGLYLNQQLAASKQIGNNRNRLPETAALRFENLDDLLPFIRAIVLDDFKQTAFEAQKHGWEFKYFIAPHPKCENSLRICNGLRTKADSQNCCVYPMITIRKFDTHFYCWNHTN